MEEYADNHDLRNTRHFTDDDISGTRFDRPGFMSMMDEVEAGHISTLLGSGADGTSVLKNHSVLPDFVSVFPDGLSCLRGAPAGWPPGKWNRTEWTRRRTETALNFAVKGMRFSQVKNRESQDFRFQAAQTGKYTLTALSTQKSLFFPGQELKKTLKKCSNANKGGNRGFMRTGLTKKEKTTDIWLDEKDLIIHIRTHNTDLKKRLAAYTAQHPDECRQTDADSETGCMEFEITKWLLLFPADCALQRGTPDGSAAVCQGKSFGWQAEMRWNCS